MQEELAVVGISLKKNEMIPINSLSVFFNELSGITNNIMLCTDH